MSHKFRIPTQMLAFSLALCAAAQAAADPDEVILTGTKLTSDFGGKSGVPLEAAPQSVQVVGAAAIAELGAQSVGDLLRLVPSANAGYSRVGPYQSFSLKLRGFLADQMRNGIRQRYYEDVDASALSNIDRVEVLKGPSGVLFGQSGVGGILSIITKQPDGQFGAQLSAMVGSHSQKMITGDFRVPVSEQLGMRVTGEIERSGTFVDHQDIDRENLAFTLRYQLSDRAVAHLVTEYVERRTQRYPGLPVEGTLAANGATPVSRAVYLGEPSEDELTADAPLIQAWVNVKLNDKWTLTPRLQYQEFNSEFTQIRLRGAQANLTTINRNGRSGRENDAYTIGQLDLSGSFATGGVEHRLLAGYEYDYERGRFTQYDITNVAPISVLNPVYTFTLTGPNRTFAYDTHHDVDGSAVYVQDQVALTSRWNVTGSARHSWLSVWSRDVGNSIRNGTHVQNTIWQLGSTFALVDGLSLFGGYSTGFDIESSGGVRAANGTPLKPEQSRQLEAGLRLSHGAFRGSLSAFQLKRVDALTTDAQNPDYSLNVGAQRVHGIELQGDWHASPLWTVSGGYALLQSKITRSNDGDQGRRLGDVPKHSATLRTAYEIPQHALTLRAGLSHVSDRPLTNGSSTRLPGYTLLDAGASIKIKTVDVDLTLANLADRRYFTASGNAFAVIPGDPRSAQLKLGTRW
ncbi:MAG TPA: TonB-dependent receptor [Steroidobacteraceae bacterium]|nr:TonB-dependent receptor [Steroidobacteraceae bacterium]